MGVLLEQRRRIKLIQLVLAVNQPEMPINVMEEELLFQRPAKHKRQVSVSSEHKLRQNVNRVFARKTIAIFNPLNHFGIQHRMVSEILCHFREKRTVYMLER